MILVNAANGQQGRELLPRLIKAGLPVRACVRSEASAEALRAAGVAEVMTGDIADPDFARRAVAGVETVYHVCPGIIPQERAVGLGWIDAARAAGVKHFVFSSVLHAVLTELVQHKIKRDIEEHLVASGLEYTVLQPTIYMAPRRFGRVLQTGMLRAGWSLDRAQSLIDIGDIAEVAHKVIVEGEPHYAATYELASRGRYTARDMGSIIGGVVGKEIPVEQISPEAYIEGIFGADLAGRDHELSVGRSLSSCYSRHDFVGNANVLSWLLGREPTTFEQFVRALAAKAG